MALLLLLLMGSWCVTAGVVITGPLHTCSDQNVTYSCTTNENQILWQWTTAAFMISPGSMFVGHFMGKALIFTSSSNSIPNVFNITFFVESQDNGTSLSCIGSTREDVTISVIQEDFLPRISLVNKFTEHESGNTSVLFLEWIITNSLKPPTVNVPGYTMYEEMKNSTYISIRNFTIIHNERYVIQVTASNCTSNTTSTFSFIEVSCIFPSLQQQEIVWPSTIAVNGSRVYYSCGVNFYPYINYTTTCVVTEEVGTWIPYPSLNCSRLCNSPPSSNAIKYFNESDIYLEDVEIWFLCINSSHNQLNVKSTQCNSSGSWFPDPLNQCMEQYESTTALIPIVRSTMTVNIEETTTSGTSLKAIGGITGALLGVATIVAAFVVIFIICWKIRTGKMKECKANTVILSQSEDTSMERHYGKLDHNVSCLRKMEDISMDRHYGKLDHNTSYPSQKMEDTSMNRHYGKLDHNASYPSQKMEPTVQDSNLHYADLSARSANIIPKMESEVVYSGILHQTTSNNISLTCNPDLRLDLNTLVLQLDSISYLWFEYGEALGIPNDTLDQVRVMESTDHDKLVEVMDFWLSMCQKNKIPTWKEISISLQSIGCDDLASNIMKVYITGHLPVEIEDDNLSTPFEQNDIPPPLPPKQELSFESQSSSSAAPFLLRSSLKSDEEQMNIEVPPPRPPKLSSKYS